MVTMELRNSECILLRRALQVYARHYQDLIAAERDPIHKSDLRLRMAAADALNTKLLTAMKESPI